MEKPKLTSFDINIYALAQGALTMAFTVQVLYLDRKSTRLNSRH